MKQKTIITLKKICLCAFLVFAASFLNLVISDINANQKQAARAEDIPWDGTTAEEFSGGDGTSGSPYEISTGKELAFLAKMVNDGEKDADNFLYSSSDKYYILTKDIILNNTANWQNWDENNAPANEWTPIGQSSSGKRFSANFNGSGFSVKGIYINSTNRQQGLFGHVDGGKILNLSVKESYIKGDIEVGGIAGYVQRDSIIENCHNDGDVFGNGSKPDSGYCVGGIAGYLSYRNSIKNCDNTGSISGIGFYVGGIAGYARDSSTIENCYNAGGVFGNDRYVGGIAGYMYNNCGIENCYNTGNISSDSNYVGGIIANLNGGNVENCYNIGNVFGDNYVGGIAGQISGNDNIKNCYNTGNVFGNNYVGGVAGQISGSSNIKNCYNTGSISGIGFYVGGIAGYVFSIVENCYLLNNIPINGIGRGNGSVILFDKDGNFIGAEKGYNDTDNLLDALNAWTDDNNKLDAVYFNWVVVKFDSMCGSEVLMQLIFKGGKAIKPSDISKDSFIFGGWFKDESYTVTYDFNKAVKENIKLFALWNTPFAGQYTVTFDTKGGSAVESKIIDKGGKITKPSDPSKDGYTFDGWYIKDGIGNDWGNKWDFDTDTVTENLTLYAKWNAETGGHLSTGEIVSIVIGAVAAAILLLIGFLIVLSAVKKRHSQS